MKRKAVGKATGLLGVNMIKLETRGASWWRFVWLHSEKIKLLNMIQKKEEGK